jgi:hypothetical protein
LQPGFQGGILDRRRIRAAKPIPCFGVADDASVPPPGRVFVPKSAAAVIHSTWPRIPGFRDSSSTDTAASRSPIAEPQSGHLFHHRRTISEYHRSAERPAPGSLPGRPQGAIRSLRVAASVRPNTPWRRPRREPRMDPTRLSQSQSGGSDDIFAEHTRLLQGQSRVCALGIVGSFRSKEAHSRTHLQFQ